MSPAAKDNLSTDQLAAVNRAFSKQSDHYDLEDNANPILRDMRQQVYAHVNRYLKPNSTILELNAGTGIDAVHFTEAGHRVHATDLSTGMIRQIESKIRSLNLANRLTVQQISYDQLELPGSPKFDYVFSNFGGLNCIKDLARVTKYLPNLLQPGAYVTFVIMPPIYVWELLWIFKGQPKQAFRRLHKNGVKAHLEGEIFETYYHSLGKIKKAFGPKFALVRSEGLCSLSPPPSPKEFALNHPGIYKMLRKMDAAVRLTFPFDRWGDHIIVTFKFLE